MSKQQTPNTEHIQLITLLITRITAKLAALGFNKKEIQHNILRITNSIVKLREGNFKNIQKSLSEKAEKEELSKKNLHLLAVELDLYLNSIYDNYDSQSQSNNLKLEHLATLQTSNKKADQEKEKQNALQKNQLSQQYLIEARYDMLRGIGKKEPTLEGYRNRRLFEKMERRRQVKLEYLNLMNY